MRSRQSGPDDAAQAPFRVDREARSVTKPLLTDDRIAELLKAEKPISAADEPRLRRKGRPKQNRAFTEAQVEIVADGRRFRIYVQRHNTNALQFSIQLVYVDADGNEYRLLRLAGRTGPHTNELERVSGQDSARVTDRFRVSRLTERYQASDYEDDGFAEAAGDRFSDFESAFEALRDLGGVTWPTPQGKLF